VCAINKLTIGPGDDDSVSVVAPQANSVASPHTGDIRPPFFPLLYLGGSRPMKPTRRGLLLPCIALCSLSLAYAQVPGSNGTKVQKLSGLWKDAAD
jgi:hypothetical protein